MKVNTVHFTPSIQTDRTAEQVSIVVFHITLPGLLFYSMVQSELEHAFKSLTLSLSPPLEETEPDNGESSAQALHSISAPECMRD
ncbi:MAG: hypothetical protein ACFE0I_22760 [Elainellaceae cyanobacterium]